MIDRLLDRFLPTHQRPMAALETVGDRSVLLDRVIAAVIDIAICYVLIEAPLLYAGMELFPGQLETFPWQGLGLSFALFLPLYVTYSFAFEWQFGRTPGKVNRGLVVAMADGHACTGLGAAVRNLLRYVDLLGVPPVVLGLVVAVITEGRRVGDLAAGTVVARTRVPESSGAVSEHPGSGHS